MKNYIVTQPKEFGTYLRGDTVNIYINIKDTLSNQLSDPSSVVITIKNPAGTIVSGPTPMSQVTIGTYEFDYSIPTSLTVYPFGIYDVAISTVTQNSLSLLNFVVFPWDVLSRTRTLSGISQQSDISDYHLAKLAWTAYVEVLETIYEPHYFEPICGGCSCGYPPNVIDGVNTLFKLKYYPIADHNGDEQVTGCGQMAYGKQLDSILI